MAFAPFSEHQVAHKNTTDHWRASVTFLGVFLEREMMEKRVNPQGVISGTILGSRAMGVLDGDCREQKGIMLALNLRRILKYFPRISHKQSRETGVEKSD